MKTISLRQFRDSVADLTEPVLVSKRDPNGGGYLPLGEWWPTGTWTSINVPQGNVTIAGPGFGSPKAAPKPGKGPKA